MRVPHCAVSAPRAAPRPARAGARPGPTGGGARQRDATGREAPEPVFRDDVTGRPC
jgi:hypothetical protein